MRITTYSLRFGLTACIGLAFAVMAAVLAGPTNADAPGVLLLIDKESIAHSQPPNEFTTQDVNDELAAVGMRDALPYFRRNAGKSIGLRTGHGENPGWFRLLGVPTRWASAPNESDGLQNFVLAGAGLGSAEESGERTRLLGDAGIASLTAANIQALNGRSVCGVVYQGDLTAAQTNANLSGRTLGLVAFRVTSVTAVEGSSFPNVQVTILDTADVCDASVALPQP